MTISHESYDAARNSAAMIDRSDRVRVSFTGPQAALTLNGLLTNDIARLAPGRGHYAAALTNKGKVVADVRVFARDGDFLVDTSAAAAPGLLAMLTKYVNPRLAKFADVSADVATVGVFGPEAARAVAAACGADATAFAGLAPYSHVQAMCGGSPCTIASVPDLGVQGFDVFSPRASAASLITALRAAGAATLDAATANVMRVEAGRPLWGTDMDENTLAQEAALDRPDIAAISFDKGCYTGQETVARVHFRGHVNRVLRGLRCATTPPAQARLAFADNTDAGSLRSTAESPRLGVIALAYVRREIADGATASLHWDGGEASAIVSALPFA